MTVDHRPGAETADEACNIAFRAIEAYAESIGVCGSCLITKSAVHAIRYVAQNARDETQLQHLLDGLLAMLRQGWADTHGEGAGMEEEFGLSEPLPDDAFLITDATDAGRVH
jgi:hypothetical protein